MEKIKTTKGAYSLEMEVEEVAKFANVCLSVEGTRDDRSVFMRLDDVDLNRIYLLIGDAIKRRNE